MYLMAANLKFIMSFEHVTYSINCNSCLFAILMAMASDSAIFLMSVTLI